MNDKVIYSQLGLPVFQNKVYQTPLEANQAVVGDVELVQSADSGLVFNRLFDQSLLNYDSSYQNEQACSVSFQHHLNEVLGIIGSHFGRHHKGIEIGCGKGYFFEMLSQNGFDVVGYDPSYEGSNTRVVREYYGANSAGMASDYFILRHVLEHIQNPWDFIEHLSCYAHPDTHIYIEVPCFEWIEKSRAFYDIFYEHVNYFTLDVLKNAFKQYSDSGKLFGGQYLYIIARLNSFHRPEKYTGRNFSGLQFDLLIDELGQLRRHKAHASYVWGAGAKGVTFANICVSKNGIDICQLIDINPAKQGKYIGLSGLPIVGPSDADLVEKDVFVMNPVYLEEIRAMTKGMDINFISVA